MGLHYLQTMCLTFEQICQGQTPWVPLGNFMNDWYELHRDCWEQLVADPLPEDYPQEYQQWAAFCAASVRWFCSTYEIVCPAWVDHPRYILAEPWYLDHPSSDWQYLRETTAEEFTRHNIYCGNNLYTNKYERDERGWPLRVHPVDLQKRRAVVRKAAVRIEQERAELKQWEQEYADIICERRAARQKVSEHSGQ